MSLDVDPGPGVGALSRAAQQKGRESVSMGMFLRVRAL